MTANTLTGIYQDAFGCGDGPSADNISFDDVQFVSLCVRVRLGELAALAKTIVDLAREDGDPGQIEAIGQGMIGILYAALDNNDRLDEYIFELKKRLRPGHTARSDDGKTPVPKSQLDQCIAFAERARGNRGFAQPEAN